ncbi:DEAD/DEAH box helicase [Rhodococcus ruber]
MFTPQSIPKVDRHNTVRQTFELEDGLPWGATGRRPTLTVRRNWTVRHTIYLGVYAIQDAYGVLDSIFEPDEQYSEQSISGHSACAALAVSADGVAFVDSTVLSGCAWAIGAAYRSAGQYARFAKTDWVADFGKAAELFVDSVDRILAAEASRRDKSSADPADIPLSVEVIECLNTALADAIGSDAAQLLMNGIRIESYTVPDKDADDVEGPGFLNSFFVDDLDYVAGQVAAGDVGQGLSTYLAAGSAVDEARRIDVRHNGNLGTVFQAIEPGAVPLGRWPAPITQPAALSQQLAVNQLRRHLLDGAGLFAVNGPPGTGKTTMLRDVIASVVVDRADALSELPSPAHAFTGSGGWQSDRYRRTVHHWRPELTGHELVVASSNNAAVENVTHEIPDRDVVDTALLGGLDYFVDTATALMNETDVLTTETRRAWGLIAARLGKKENRTRFLTHFWFDSASNRFREAGSADREGFNTILRRFAATGPTESWADSVERYRRVRARVVDVLARRQRIADLVARTGADRRRLDELETEMQKSRRKLDELESAVAELRRRLESAEELRALRTEALSDHESTKARLRSRILHRSAHHEWVEKRTALADAADEADRRLASSKGELTNLLEKRSEAHRALADMSKEASQLSERLKTSRAELATACRQWGRFAFDPSWLEDPERREAASLWLDEECCEVRSRLFAAAVELHMRFIQQVPERLRQSLTAATDLLSGRAPKGIARQDALAAWQALFFVVPVVSTTFASFATMFRRLGAEDLGWLLIDEAGQSAPQNAVGAIWRSRRTVIVGDPLQLEPVVTIPLRLQKAILDACGVGDEWLPSRASTQTLADRHNTWGTLLPIGDELAWVGAPLRIHRRCDDPMFSISNVIAYDRMMLSAVPRRPPLPIPPSAWLDMRGTARGHFVSAEATVLESLLRTLRSGAVDPREILVVTPFRAVAAGIRHLCENFAVAGGTVHTAQGREADVVIVVLGGDPERPGAKRWASSRPNLLNVAVSRAKRRIYVIGDRREWSRYPYFATLAQHLPTAEAVHAARPDSDASRSRIGTNPTTVDRIGDTNSSIFEAEPLRTMPRESEPAGTFPGRRRAVHLPGSPQPSRVESCRIEHRPQDGDHFQRVYLRSGPLPISHIDACFAGRYRPVGDVHDLTGGEFTHAFDWATGVPTNFRHLVELLQKCLVLVPGKGAEVDLLLALDWYKRVDPELDPGKWLHTTTGALIHRSKYQAGSLKSQLDALDRLTENMSLVIDRHPALSDVVHLLTVPGSAGDGGSFGEQLARRVARATGKNLIRTIGAQHAARKANPRSELDGLSLPTMVHEPCLVIDDVLRSGTTMRAVAIAARRAGAPTVYGLAAAKTLRN